VWDPERRECGCAERDGDHAHGSGTSHGLSAGIAGSAGVNDQLRGRTDAGEQRDHSVGSCRLDCRVVRAARGGQHDSRDHRRERVLPNTERRPLSQSLHQPGRRPGERALEGRFSRAASVNSVRSHSAEPMTALYSSCAIQVRVVFDLGLSTLVVEESNYLDTRSQAGIVAHRIGKSHIQGRSGEGVSRADPGSKCVHAASRRWAGWRFWWDSRSPCSRRRATSEPPSRDP